MFDSQALKDLVKEAIREELASTEREYRDFADVKEFAQIVGVSISDVKTKVLYKEDFKHCRRKFENSNKWYIHIEDGRKVVNKLLKG